MFYFLTKKYVIMKILAVDDEEDMQTLFYAKIQK